MALLSTMIAKYTCNYILYVLINSSDSGLNNMSSAVSEREEQLPTPCRIETKQKWLLGSNFTTVNLLALYTIQASFQLSMTLLNHCFRLQLSNLFLDILYDLSHQHFLSNQLQRITINNSFSPSLSKLE